MTKLFADGADKQGILEMYKNPRIDGFTTNPTLMRKAGITDYVTFAKEILDEITDKPVSFEVFADEFEEMERQALEIAEVLVRSSALDVVVVDSVAALVPRAEIEGEMGDSHVGLQARLMSQALRKLTGAIGRSNTAVIFTNQIREKIGVMYGSPETTSGGRALKFYASLRLDIRRIASIKEANDQIGNRTRVKVVKNKCAPPFKQAEFDIMFNRGVSREGLLVDMGEEIGVVNRAGAWYSYGNDLRLGQGRELSLIHI